MTLEVQVISKEIIKPSSPTPDHLRCYRLSFLDQITTPNMYTPLVLFFEYNGQTQLDIKEISSHLKKSLTDVLTLYYPLAGVRANDNMYVDCNDQGVPYLEAHVINCKLSDILQNPIHDQLTKLVPFELDDIGNQIPFGVQLNIFDCGGFAIGQCFSHKIADGLSIVMFSNAWAATTRRALGDPKAEITCPELVSATLFPPKLVAESETISGLAKRKLVTKRFVFDASNIEQLRARYEQLKRPTRVETLTAFIWSRFVAVTRDDHGIYDNQQKLHKVMQVVNLRRRFDPPLARHSFGNIITVAQSTPLLNTGEECYGLARQVREAIRKIDIKKLQQGHDDHGSSSEGSTTVTSIFTSLCNFPLYDSDFGWGRPSWVSIGMPGLDFNNVVIFTDTRDARGIEASITSAEEVLSGLETDTEFLKRVRPGWVGSCINFTPKAATTASINNSNRVRMVIKKTSAETKLRTWGSGSVRLFGLGLKLLKRR